MKMNNKKKEKGNNVYFQIIVDFVKKNSVAISMMILSFVLVSALNFLNISTTQTVASFDIDGFEIGQIADRTIVANKTFFFVFIFYLTYFLFII